MEGNPTTGSPTKTITFVVRLNRVSANAVTTNWATRNGSGSTRALAGSDYVAASGTITIPAGSTQTTVTVTIKKDRTREPAEHFFVGLTGLQNTSFGDGPERAPSPTTTADIGQSRQRSVTTDTADHHWSH